MFGILIALVEICIGVIVANIVSHFFGPNASGSSLEWLRFLASAGAILLTFLVATVIASAVISTLIANLVFLPHHLLDQKKKVDKLMAEGMDEE